MTDTSFVVEQAGCASCAALVEAALTPLAHVHTIEVDEAADTAAVRLAFSPNISKEAVDHALADASGGAGHHYRVKPGSWIAAP